MLNYNNLFCKCSLIWLFIVLNFSDSFAESFKFKDTNPVFNLAVQEEWLKQNPQQNEQRILRLIKVERTYYWQNMNMLGTFLSEIKDFGIRTNNLHVKASYFYLNALKFYIENNHLAAFNSGREALLTFQEIDDLEGILYVNCLLIQLAYDRFGGAIMRSDFFLNENLKNIEKHINIVKNEHLKLQMHFSKLIYLYSNGKLRNYSEYEKQVNNLLSFCLTKPQLNYSYHRIKRLLAISYFFQNRYKDSFKLNIELLNDLNELQFEERAAIYYNLSNDCFELKEYKKGLIFGLKAIEILNLIQSKNNRMFYAIYRNLQFFSYKIRDIDRMQSYSDSTIKYIQIETNINQASIMTEIQGKFLFDQKKSQIERLEFEKLIGLLIILAGSLIAVFISYLSVKLYRKNSRLNNLIQLRENLIKILAHDLRRPLHAFTGLNALVSKLLKNKQYESIKTISDSIDISSIGIMQTMDNLMYWAMTQKESYVIEYREFFINDILISIRDLYLPVCLQKNISIVINCPTEKIIKYDKNVLSLIIRNLVDNACKCLNTSGVIKVSISEINSSEFEILVEDNGPGFDPKILEVFNLVIRQRKGLSFISSDKLGLGLNMIAFFSKHSNLLVQIDSYEDRGSKIRLGPFYS
ncbi:MAG: sensor histidine kinase [Spirosomataceae bacterium]